MRVFLVDIHFYQTDLSPGKSMKYGKQGNFFEVLVKNVYFLALLDTFFSTKCPGETNRDPHPLCSSNGKMIEFETVDRIGYALRKTGFRLNDTVLL